MVSPFDEDLSFRVGDPVITIENTKSVNQQYEATGLVKFPIVQGKRTTATLSFPFENARNDAAAIKQGLAQLSLVSGAISAFLTRNGHQ